MGSNRTPLVASGGPVTAAIATMQTSVDRAPAVLPVFPWFQALTRSHRTQLEALIEELIAYLDQSDEDADLEDGFDAEMTAAEWTETGAHRFNVGVLA